MVFSQILKLSMTFRYIYKCCTCFWNVYGVIYCQSVKTQLLSVQTDVYIREKSL